MNKQTGYISLDEFDGGSVLERFNIEMAKIGRNIWDPNTDPEKNRTLTLKLTFKADKNRQGMKVKVDSNVSLAPHLSNETMMLIGKDIRTGRIEMREINNPGNAISLPGESIPVKAEVMPTAPQVQSFDPETGEIYEPPTRRQEPIDLRAATN